MQATSSCTVKPPLVYRYHRSNSEEERRILSGTVQLRFPESIGSFSMKFAEDEFGTDLQILSPLTSCAPNRKPLQTLRSCRRVLLPWPIVENLAIGSRSLCLATKDEAIEAPHTNRLRCCFNSAKFVIGRKGQSHDFEVSSRWILS